MSSSVGKGAISVAFVCPSVCPSVTYMANRIIPEPKGLAWPNLEGRFPTLDSTRAPVSKSNGQGYRRAGGGHTVSTEPGGYTACLSLLTVNVNTRPSLCLCASDSLVIYGTTGWAKKPDCF